MKNTWLVSTSTHQQVVFDLLAYHDYLLKLNLSLFSPNGTTFSDNRTSPFFVMRYFIREMNNKTNFSSYQSKSKSKFLRLKTKTLFKQTRKLKSVLLASKKLTFRVSTIFPRHDLISYFFNAFFLMNHIPVTYQQTLHHNFHLLGASQSRTKIVIVEPKKFFRRWRDVYTLLSNFCYFNSIPLVYSSSFFKREILSINWHFNRFNVTTWRNIYPLFLTKTTIYNRKINFIFEKLKKLRFSFALITDCEQHYKLLYYFNYYKWYTIGLIPNNIDPWLVSFAVPVLQNNLFMQFYFIKFFVLIRKTVSYQKFNFQRNLWSQYHLRCLKTNISEI